MNHICAVNMAPTPGWLSITSGRKEQPSVLRCTSQPYRNSRVKCDEFSQNRKWKMSPCMTAQNHIQICEQLKSPHPSYCLGSHYMELPLVWSTEECHSRTNVSWWWYNCGSENVALTNPKELLPIRSAGTFSRYLNITVKNRYYGEKQYS